MNEKQLAEVSEISELIYPEKKKEKRLSDKFIAIPKIMHFSDGREDRYVYEYIDRAKIVGVSYYGLPTSEGKEHTICLTIEGIGEPYYRIGNCPLTPEEILKLIDEE